ncbi:MAG: ABC transporter substrate-binding protein [Candidatus Solibacter usitatus]|nr:ABC transporter substrate-binding protein [Candidatus Solibacter usitatus]
MTACRHTAIPAILLLAAAAAIPAGPSELRFCLRSDPRSFDPLNVADESSETVRYLTHGFLVRMNRRTLKLEPSLAESWRVSSDGRGVRFRLRSGVKFSDGAPFTSADVARTISRATDPALKPQAGDALRRDEGAPRITVHNAQELTVAFAAPIAGLDYLFDELPILSAHSPLKDGAGLGPFVLAEYRAGSHLNLTRNPYYWARDAKGAALPYFDRVRIDIQQNREIEMARFRRGELHFISALDVENFDRLAAVSAASARDGGLSLESEMLWFNQAASARLPVHKLAWFRSTAFRRAISDSIRRDDIVRLVYKGRAAPGYGPFSPAARPWFNASLKAAPYDPQGALQRLAAEGFRLQSGVLRDSGGNAVEFSLITNSGNRNRARMASLIEQDLARIGVKIVIVPLEMPSLLERITRTLQYDACLLGLVGVDLDPNDQMNMWLSSSATHQWNPRQATPETAWEAAIDRLMKAQAVEGNLPKRIRLIHEMQRIVREQAPMIYLAHPHALLAVSPQLANAEPAAFRPRVLWNVERLAPIHQPEVARVP